MLEQVKQAVAAEGAAYANWDGVAIVAAVATCDRSADWRTSRWILVMQLMVGRPDAMRCSGMLMVC